MMMKIRRYIYSDVINRQDLCKLFNCSGIQVCKEVTYSLQFIVPTCQFGRGKQYSTSFSISITIIKEIQALCSLHVNLQSGVVVLRRAVQTRHFGFEAWN